MIIDISCKEDISANDVINKLLKDYLEKYPSIEGFTKDSSRELILEKAAVNPNFTNNDISICNNMHD